MGQLIPIPHTQLEWLEIWDRLQAEVMENPELRTNLEHLDRRLAVEALAFGTTAYELVFGRSPQAGRAGRPTDQAPAGLGDPATIPNAGDAA